MYRSHFRPERRWTRQVRDSAGSVTAVRTTGISEVTPATACAAGVAIAKIRSLPLFTSVWAIVWQDEAPLRCILLIRLILDSHLIKRRKKPFCWMHPVHHAVRTGSHRSYIRCRPLTLYFFFSCIICCLH